MQIREINISEIKEYAKNAKKHPDKQVVAIAKSIGKFGFRQPLVLDKNMEIVIGHGRFLAAKMIHMATVPCVMADDLTEEQIKALRIADNKTNESEWDFGLLGEELAELVDIDMTDLGFNEAEILELQIDDSPEEIPVSTNHSELSENNEGASPYSPAGYTYETGMYEAGRGSAETGIAGNEAPVYSEGITREDLNRYSQHAEQLVTRRVIIVYSTEEEENYLKKVLSQEMDKPLRVVLDVKRIMQACEGNHDEENVD